MSIYTSAAEMYLILEHDYMARKREPIKLNPNRGIQVRKWALRLMSLIF